MVGKPDEAIEDLPDLVKRDLRVVNAPKDIKKERFLEKHDPNSGHVR